LTPDQQTQVDSLFGQLTAQHDAIAAALTPVAAPAAFVVKVDGETWADYNVRLVNYNASVPIANQAPALDEATWDALPVG
jgi:hypothetical protein